MRPRSHTKHGGFDKTELKTDIGAVVEHPREHLQTGPRLLMSCTHVLCTFKTNYLTRKVAIKRPYNHQRKKHPRDLNNKFLRG